MDYYWNYKGGTGRRKLVQQKTHRWPFYLRISKHAFIRAHQRIPEFTNTGIILDMVMPIVDMDKFNSAPEGVCKITTPEFVYLVNKFSDDAALLITIIPRHSMTPKNISDYHYIYELAIPTKAQLKEARMQSMWRD